MEQYKTDLKNGVVLAIVSSGKVLPLRVQELRVIINFRTFFDDAIVFDRNNCSKIEFKQNTVTVYFTLLDKSSFYGPVDPTPKEVSLDDAIELLNKTVNAKQFVIPLVYGDKQASHSYARHSAVFSGHDRKDHD
jgi:hypothetical protein